MSQPVVFYSWQSDLPRQTTRDIIHDAAVEAVRRVAGTARLEDAPRFDQDTLGEAGSPQITETIFRKIRDSALFLADVTFVSKTEGREGQKAKKLPNPNVMLELGYAAAMIGWDRVILIMNKAYGSPESLPFDLRNRRFPLTFDLPPASSKPLPIGALVGGLEEAIQTHLAREYGRVEDTLSRLSSYSRQMIIRHANDLQFWENNQENVILSRLDLSISQMLDLGLIRCGSAASESGLAYTWTYLGRECIRRLGIALPSNAPTVLPMRASEILQTPFYDSILGNDGAVE